MTAGRQRLISIAWGVSTLLVVAAAAVLISEHVRETRRRASETVREAELQQSARHDLAAAATLAKENELRTSRSLALRGRSQIVGLVLIVAGAGFVATGRYVPLFNRRAGLPPCKRGDKCQVLKARRAESH
ncbi:MAG: hypothetical protein AMXMBFR47_16460 [Planctomycetota bacterium]